MTMKDEQIIREVVGRMADEAPPPLDVDELGDPLIRRQPDSTRRQSVKRRVAVATAAAAVLIAGIAGILLSARAATRGSESRYRILIPLRRSSQTASPPTRRPRAHSQPVVSPSCAVRTDPTTGRCVSSTPKESSVSFRLITPRARLPGSEAKVSAKQSTSPSTAAR